MHRFPAHLNKIMKHDYTFTAVLTLAFLSAACGSPATINNGTNSPKAVSANSGRVSESLITTNSNSVAAQKPFTKTFELHGIKFVVESPNTTSGNTVKVTPAGLEISNDVQMKAVSGEVYGAEVGDLNVDQSPEIYIYVRDLDGKKKTSLIAYSANKKKSLSEINLPADDPNSKELVGFNGGDEFAVVESSLVRRFSVYDGATSEANKTGKTRQIQYKLRAGEASWQLVVDKVTEF